MIGLFLALLELIRRRRVRATQERPFAPIRIELLDPTPLRVEEIRNNNLEEDSESSEPAARPVEVPHPSRRPEENGRSPADSATLDFLANAVHERGVGEGATPEVATPTGNDQTLETEPNHDPQ
jgi:hypothetical protein